MMTEDVKQELSNKEPTDTHKKILDHVMQLASYSRGAISTNYARWDYANAVYKGERPVDHEDRQRAKDGKPIKMVVPLNFAQVQTWVSFLFLLFTQNRTFFELQPSGDEDFRIRADAELVMQRDVNHVAWPFILFQFLLDTGRFGLGILECSWDEEFAYFLPEQVAAPREPQMFEGMMVDEGGNIPTPSASAEPIKILRYQGNVIGNISPYRWFPDPNFPIVDFQKGEFCGHECDYTRSELERMELDGEVAGIEHLTEMTKKTLGNRKGGETRIGFTRESEPAGVTRTSRELASDQSLGIDLVSKFQVKIIPRKFKLQSGKHLGKEKWPVMYHVWFANDDRIIRLEPTKTLHGKFGYSHGEFTPDMHQFTNAGLGDVIDKLQSVITWFVNSHVKAVERVNKNQMIADPAGVDVETINSEDPVILLKKGASKVGVDKWIQQLQVMDTTGRHMEDVDILTKMVQIITGVNDNAMGQYNSGRRSATESRAVTSGAAGRMKTIGTVIWATGFTPMGRMMLTNSRAGLSYESFMRITGRPDPADSVKVAECGERYRKFRGTLEDIIGGEDFFVFDSTLNSEKGFIAQSLQELLQVMMVNPVISKVLDIDIKAVFEEMMYLRGTTNIKRFSLSSNVQAGLTQEPNLALMQQEVAPTPQ